MRKVIITSILLAISIICWSQTNTVSLVASGDGASKTEAESMALRSVIEQAFGTFVSANTSILNDEVVKDEIATISSGNIERYSVISETELNGLWFVTVRAVVSINKLVDYAKNHGSSTEFAGQSFAMQMKMRKLNKENEEKVLFDLLAQVELVSSTSSLFDYKIEQNEPQHVTHSEYKVPIKILASWNDNGISLINVIKKTYESLSLLKKEQASYQSNNYPMVSCKPLENITGEQKNWYMRSNMAMEVISAFQINFLLNLHCFSVIRKGSGVTDKSFFIEIKDECERFDKGTVFYLNPILSETTLYETEGFEVIPNLALRDTKPKIVDLGLSVKWADRNVGASSLLPLGEYYRWRSMIPFTTGMTDVLENIIKHNQGDELIAQYDIADVKYGDGWRMPSEFEWKELYTNCTWSEATINGQVGWTITSKINGNSIFLPRNGKREVGYNFTMRVGQEGYYYFITNSSEGFIINIYCMLYHYDSIVLVNKKPDPSLAMSVRAVYE